jgi:FecR protein
MSGGNDDVDDDRGKSPMASSNARLAPSPEAPSAELVATVLRASHNRAFFQPRIAAPLDRDATVSRLSRALVWRRRRAGLRRQMVPLATFSAAAAVLLVAVWMVARRPATLGAVAPLVGDTGARAERTMTVLAVPAIAPTADGVAPVAAQGAAQVGGGMVVSGDGVAPRPLTRGMTLETGTGLVAPQGNEVRIGTMQGTVLTLEPAGELTLDEQGGVQRFSLRRGAVRAEVAPLQSSERFIIGTADAQIEVHGTAFRVALVDSDRACGGGIRTRVAVTAGVVSVRAGVEETFVAAGEEWPRGCAAGPGPAPPALSPGPLLGAPSSTTGAPTARRRHTLATTSHPRASSGASSGRAQGSGTRGPMVTASLLATGRSTAAAAGSSSLAAENDLFLAALRARREVRPRDALRSLGQLLDGYPDGPLTEAAMAERMHVLGTFDPAAAARAAAQYLRRFPEGFARDDADRLAGAAP